MSGRQENQLVCTIEDNGVGRDRAQQLRDKSVIKSKSIGLKITEERLRLRNRMRQCIQITDLKDTLNQGVGTRVTIHIPIEEYCPEVVIKEPSRCASGRRVSANPGSYSHHIVSFSIIHFIVWIDSSAGKQGRASLPSR